LISVHCTAHRLELALKDAAKSLSYFTNTIDPFFLNIYKFYHNSALNWTELQNSAEALKINVLKPVNTQGTRWVAHRLRAMQAVDRDWAALVMHMNDLNIQHKNADKQGKAKGFLNTLLSMEFIFHLYVLLPVFSAISGLSETLQSNQATIETVVTKVKSTITVLKQINVEEKVTQFYAKNITDMKFRNEPLKLGNTRKFALDVEQVKSNVTDQCSKYITQVIEAVESRFDNFNSPILKAFQVFNPKHWDTADEGYGVSDIETLIEHFESLLEIKGIDKHAIIPEWYELLVHGQSILTSYPHLKKELLEFWSVILSNEYPDRFKNVSVLIMIMLLIAIASAEAERGFSLMGIVKSDFRSALGADHLTDLMTIKLSGVKLETFNPEPALANWWAAKKRRMVKPHGAHLTKEIKETLENDSISESDGENV